MTPDQRAREHSNLVISLRALFLDESNLHGQRLLMWLAKACCFTTPTTGATTEQTLIRSGKHDLLLDLLRTAQMTDDEIINLHLRLQNEQQRIKSFI